MIWTVFSSERPLIPRFVSLLVLVRTLKLARAESAQLRGHLALAFLAIARRLIAVSAANGAQPLATLLAERVDRHGEKDLVAQYHRALLGYGITDYDFDTCWRDYRLGVVQAPLLTGLGFAFAASTERGDEMMLTMLHRGCRAIRELETLELIRSYESV